MEEDFRKGEDCPQLLDLIPNERVWMVKEVGGGGKGFVVSGEKKLELRLGLPGGEDWSEVMEKAEEHSIESVLSPGRYKLSKTSGINPSSVGAKKGFFDTVESKTEGCNNSILAFSNFRLKGRNYLRKQMGEQSSRALREACGSSVAHGSAAAPSGNAVGANNSSQTRLESSSSAPKLFFLSFLSKATLLVTGYLFVGLWRCPLAWSCSFLA